MRCGGDNPVSTEAQLVRSHENSYEKDSSDGKMMKIALHHQPRQGVMEISLLQQSCKLLKVMKMALHQPIQRVMETKVTEIIVT